MTRRNPGPDNTIRKAKKHTGKPFLPTTDPDTDSPQETEPPVVLQDTTPSQSPDPDPPPPPERIADVFTRRTVTTTMITIALLTFTFSFGNVWALGLRLGVAPSLAPLIGPAVDLSVIGLIVGIRHLALSGVRAAELRPARALLAFSGLATLALNVAEPAMQGLYGKAAFDAVGPLLLIGWSEVGPYLLSRLQETPTLASTGSPRNAHGPSPDPDRPAPTSSTTPPAASGASLNGRSASRIRSRPPAIPTPPEIAALVQRAQAIDRRYRGDTGGRPVSAEVLRRELRIGASRARELTKIIRSGPTSTPGDHEGSAVEPFAGEISDPRDRVKHPVR